MNKKRTLIIAIFSIFILFIFSSNKLKASANVDTKPPAVLLNKVWKNHQVLNNKNVKLDITKEVNFINNPPTNTTSGYFIIKTDDMGIKKGYHSVEAKEKIENVKYQKISPNIYKVTNLGVTSSSKGVRKTKEKGFIKINNDKQFTISTDGKFNKKDIVVYHLES